MNTGLTRKLFGARIAEMFLIPFDVLETFFQRRAHRGGKIANIIHFELRVINGLKGYVFPSCKNGAQRGSFSVVLVHA